MTTLPDLILKYNRILGNTQTALNTLLEEDEPNRMSVAVYNRSQQLLNDFIKDLEQLNNNGDTTETKNMCGVS